MPIGTHVYRAVKYKNWVKGGVPSQTAFRRRSQFDERGEERNTWDDDGVSFGLTPEAACQDLEENFGVLKLAVQSMSDRHFEFDDPTDSHVNVTNVPFYCEEERDEANTSAAWFVECVVEILPPILNNP